MAWYKKLVLVLVLFFVFLVVVISLAGDFEEADEFSNCIVEVQVLVLNGTEPEAGKVVTIEVWDELDRSWLGYAEWPKTNEQGLITSHYNIDHTSDEYKVGISGRHFEHQIKTLKVEQRHSGERLLITFEVQIGT